VAFIAVTAVASLVAASLTIVAARRTMGDAVERALQSQARTIFDDVEHLLQEQAILVERWSGSTAVDNVLIGDVHLELVNFLLEARAYEPDFTVLTVTDASGLVVASTDAGSIGRHCAVEVDDLVKLEQTALRRGPFPGPGNGPDPTFILAHPLRSHLAGNNLGWLIAVTRWEPVRQIVRLASTPTEQRPPLVTADLLDAEGRLLVSGNGRALSDAQRHTERYLTAIADDANNDFPLTRGLSVRIRMRRSIAYSAGRGQTIAILGAGFVGLVSAAGVGLLIAHGMSRRIRQVADGARQLADGRLEHQVPEQGHDEIATLANRFNAMAQRLSTAHDEVAQAGARWQSLVENAPDIIVTVLPDGTVDFINHVLPGYRLDMVVGTMLFDWIAPEHHDTLRAGLEQVVQAGEPLTFEARGTGPHGGTAWYSMRLGPIIRDGRTLGVTLIATDITERRRLEQEILDVSERERRRIGLDLHDGLGQTLTGTALICRGLSSRLTEQGAEWARDVTRIGSLIQDAIAQTRAIARGLYPLALDTQGLRGALESLASSVDGIPGVSCSVTGEATPDAFTTIEATHLFRIAQEAVINALRHASARHLTIHIDAGPRGRGLSVADDGKGLPQEPDKEGLGFRLMRYRAGIIGGKFSIHRGESGGTVIQCNL